MRRITFSRMKWGHRPHYDVPAYVLGEDEHGTWTATDQGSMITRGAEELFPANNDSVNLLPNGTWWSVWFQRDGPLEVYVDIIMPIEWVGDAARCIDLDLDVIRLRDGEIRIVDEDELEAHTILYGYPADVVERAQATAVEVKAMLEQRIPPFDGTPDRWWAERDAAAPEGGREVDLG